MKSTILTISALLLFVGCGGGSGAIEKKEVIDIKSEANLTSQLPSTYALKEITVPVCNVSDPRVQIIQTKDDWLEINNNHLKSIFCVRPGNYRDGRAVSINRSGTKDNPLYIVLDNGNNEHPVKLTENQLASVDLEFENSDYWIIDRMASINTSSIEDHPLLFKNSSHNIVNRHFIDKSSGGITIRDSSNSNTIQNSRFQDMTKEGLKHDRSAIILEPKNSISEIKNTNILHNEIHNFNDGIHLLWREQIQSVNFDGTVIYDNDISVDKTIYTDCMGKPDENGTCSYSENAIDIKSGSKDANNPIVVKNNRLWGFRKSDQTDSSLGDPGAAIVIHYGVRYVSISDNTIFDSVQGILSVEKKRLDYSLLHANISKNNIFNIEYPFVITEAVDISISENYVVNSLKAWLVLDHTSDGRVDDNQIVNKKSVNAIEDRYATNVIAKGNLYFETTNLRDKSFKTDKFSGNPTTVNPLP